MNVGDVVLATPRELGTVARKVEILALFVQPAGSRIKRHRVRVINPDRLFKDVFAVRVDDLREC